MRPDQLFEEWVLAQRRKYVPESRRTRASGAMHFEPGDVKDPNLLIECKHSIKSDITLQWGWWKKVAGEADRSNKIPVLVFGFGSRWHWGETVGVLVAERVLEADQLPGVPQETWTCQTRKLTTTTPRRICWNDVDLAIVPTIGVAPVSPQTQYDWILARLRRAPQSLGQLQRTVPFGTSTHTVKRGLAKLLDDGKVELDNGLYRVVRVD